MPHTKSLRWPLAEILRKTILLVVGITTTTFPPCLPITEDAVLIWITGAPANYLWSKCVCDNGQSFAGHPVLFQTLLDRWAPFRVGKNHTSQRTVFTGLSPCRTQNVSSWPGWGPNGGRSLLNIRALVSPPASALWCQGQNLRDPGRWLSPPPALLVSATCGARACSITAAGTQEIHSRPDISWWLIRA